MTHISVWISGCLNLCLNSLHPWLKNGATIPMTTMTTMTMRTKGRTIFNAPGLRLHGRCRACYVALRKATFSLIRQLFNFDLPHNSARSDKKYYHHSFSSAGLEMARSRQSLFPVCYEVTITCVAVKNDICRNNSGRGNSDGIPAE